MNTQKHVVASNSLPTAYCLLPTLSALLLCSCASPQKPAAGPATKPVEQVASVDMGAWMHGLQGQVDALVQADHQLPGHDLVEHRERMADAFGALEQILPSLHGPVETGQFTQQLRTLQTTRAQLSSGSAELSQEPAVDLGLRAAASALSDIAHNNATFADRAEITQNLDQLQQKLAQLDVQRGALHRVVQADAVDAITRIVQAMSGVMNEKINGTAAVSQ